MAWDRTPPHVTMATFLTLDANAVPDGQRYVVTDDNYAEWEAVGPDGTRTWVRIGNPGIPDGGATDQIIVKQSGADQDVAWETQRYRQWVGPWTVDNLTPIP